MRTVNHGRRGARTGQRHGVDRPASHTGQPATRARRGLHGTATWADRLMFYTGQQLGPRPWGKRPKPRRPKTWPKSRQRVHHMEPLALRRAGGRGGTRGDAGPAPSRTGTCKPGLFTALGVNDASQVVRKTEESGEHRRSQKEINESVLLLGDIFLVTLLKKVLR